MGSLAFFLGGGVKLIRSVFKIYISIFVAKSKDKIWRHDLELTGINFASYNKLSVRTRTPYITQPERNNIR